MKRRCARSRVPGRAYGRAVTRFARLLCLVLAAFVAGPLRAQTPNGTAQAVRIVPGALDAAIAQVRRGGLDVVYTRSLVARVQTACRYEGSDARAALACALAGTGLEAVAVGPRQVALRRHTVAVDPLRPSSSAPQTARVRRVSLAGFVLDAATGEVLPGAVVVLPEARRGVQASLAGYFVVPSLEDGRYRVRASYVGYEPLDTALDADQARAVLRLRPSRIEVREVVVERSRALLAAPPGTSDLAAAELDGLPAPFGEQDLLRKLEWLPGVSRAGAASGGLLVRGGEPDENLYLLDDAPVYHPWHAFTLVSTFQAETVSQVRLYRGIFPAEHGGRLSSVVETELRDGNQEEPALTVGIGVLAGRYLLETPVTKGLSLMVSARRSYVDKLIGARHPVASGGLRDTLRTAYFFGDLNVKATWRPGFRHRVSATYYQGGDRLDVRLPFDTPLGLTSLLRPSSITPSDLVFDVDHTWGNRLASVRHQYLASRRVVTTATAYVTSYDARERTLLRPTQADVIRADYGVALTETGLRLSANAALSSRTTLNTGLQGALRRFESLLFSTTLAPRAGTLAPSGDSLQRLEVDGVEGVAYAQVRHAASPRLDVQGGLRATVLGPGRYAYVLPNVSAQWRVVPDRAVVRVGAGAALQSMQRLRDRTSLLYDLVAERWIPVTRQVPPALGVQVAAGGDVRLGPAATLSVEGYRRAARDVLMPSDDPLVKDALGGAGIDLAALLGQYVRADARVWGVEASVQGATGPWRYLAAYTAERSTRRIVGRPAFGVSRYDVPHRLEASVERRIGPVTAGLSGEVRTGFPEAVPVARYRMGDGLGTPPVVYLERPATLNGRLPPYGRLDATVRVPFHLLDARVEATLQLYNLLTYRNVFERVYAPTADGVTVGVRRGLPLLPLLELSARL